jgi:hypothetical protein
VTVQRHSRLSLLLSMNKRLDDLLRKAVLKNESRCYVCGRDGTDVAHLFVRNKLATRWDRRNCHLLCRACHALSHQCEDVYTKAFIRREGQEAYDALRLASNQMVGNVRGFMDQVEKNLSG